MKNQALHARVHNALNGLTVALKSESSFRIQSFCAVVVLGVLPVLRPKPIWWAVTFLTVFSVLAAELMNTALEMIIDRLHPEKHPAIGHAKDCAAAAVMLLSMASVGVAAALIFEHFNG